ncbi:MAG: YbhN family protein [Promethearchaeota archaeon]
MTFRERIPSILIYGITIAVLIGIILFIGVQTLIQYFTNLELTGIFTLLILLILLYVIDIIIRIYRWQILLMVQGVELPIKSLTFPVVSALAINLFTPARAGETIRLYTLKRNHETKYSDTLSSIVIEQVLSIIGLLFVVTGSLFFVGRTLIQIENSEIILQLVVIIFLSSVMCLIILSLMMYKPKIIENLIQFFPLFIQKRLQSAYKAFQTGVKELREKPSYLTLGIITSASIWVIEGIMIYVIAFTVFLFYGKTLTPMDFPWMIAASCAGNITFIIPILPGAVGQYEVVLALVLVNSPNYPGHGGTLIAIIDRIAKSIMLGLFGGYATLRLGGKEIIRLRKDFFSETKEQKETLHEEVIKE